MKQAVEIIIKLNYTEQTLDTPSLQTIRRDLYDLLINEQLSYDEVRTDAHASYTKRIVAQQPITEGTTVTRVDLDSQMEFAHSLIEAETTQLEFDLKQ